MGPYVDSVVSDEVMPAATGVVVIGGGVIGTFAALTLAGRGIPVVLCEKGYIACEQSSRNWGWCRQAGRDVREMPLIVQSLQLWRDMNRVTEPDTGFRQCGVLSSLRIAPCAELSAQAAEPPQSSLNEAGLDAMP
jgi:glycine/D-amino acid oxidase-like deaminating enzyme